jgi:hypothetical protein
MLVDGNLDYRFFFVTQAGTFGTIQEAESGAAAIARFRDSPAQIVFIGSELGVVNAEALAKRLRHLRPDGPLRLIGLVDEDVPPARTRVFDDVMPRTLVAEAFRASIRPFVDIPGPFSSFLDVVPELLALTSSAATQVFGMMFDTEVRPRDSAAGLVAAARADVAIVVDDRFVITVGVHMDAPAVTAVAVKMFGATEISDDDRASVAAELSNLVAGRIHAHLRDRGLASVPRLPVGHPPGPLQPLPAAEGVTSPFGIEGTGDFVISLLVNDRDADPTQHHDAVTQPGGASPTGPADTAPEAGSPGTGENALPAGAHTGSPASVA